MVKPATLIRQYKKHSSGFKDWDQASHADKWLLFPENVGPNLSIDEVSMSNGELYTLLTNKSGKGRKGSLVASIQGTRTRDLVWVLLKLPARLRATILEISMDMAKNIESAVREVFFNAKIVTDRLHYAILSYCSVVLRNASRYYVSRSSAGSTLLATSPNSAMA